MTWMKQFTYVAFLCTFFEYRGAGGTKGCCVCTYGDKVYNLAPLQRTDGPRFTIHGGKKMPAYMFDYNPCTSFIKKGEQSSCLNDTAICMWAENSGIPINIGFQSTAECGTDSVTGAPHLKYQSSYGPEWHSTVTLMCNRTEKTVKEATFVLSQDMNNEYHFILSHICACAGGCPLDPVTTRPLPGTTTPTPVTTKPIPGTTEPTPGSTKTTTTPYSAWKVIWEPVTIAAGSVVFVFIAISVIWLLIKRQNQPNDDNERRPLIVEEDSGIDESRNSFTNFNDTRNAENARYASLIKSASSSSCSDITMPNKDVFDKTGVASVPV